MRTGASWHDAKVAIAWNAISSYLGCPSNDLNPTASVSAEKRRTPTECACILFGVSNRLRYFSGNASTLPFCDAATTTSSADKPEMLGERTNDSPLLLPS